MLSASSKSLFLLSLSAMTSASSPKLLDFPIQKCTSAGGCVAEATKVTLDANWRWYYHPDNYQNCFDNGFTCDSDASCSDCVLTGDVDYGAYGISTAGDELTLSFKAPNGGIGSRVYVVEGDQYKTMDLRNQEISMDVDIGLLGCGLNGAVYFSEMSADGGSSRGNQGASYGTGYCDAQCPDDLHVVDGKANIAGKHQCCNEMDIWEANGISNALTPHTCKLPSGADMVGPAECSEPDCGVADRYASICDKNGCDLNPYRFGDTDFYGPNKQVDTTRKFTVTTRFLANARGELAEIQRSYYQKDASGTVVEIMSPTFQVNGNAYDSITDQMCADLEAPSPAGFSSQSTFLQKGGLSSMGDSFARGMVLVLSIWDDVTSNMLWLDGTAAANGEPSDMYGANRGPCSSGVDRNSAEANNAKVKYSNIRYGDLGSTSPIGSSSTTGVNSPTNGPSAAQPAPAPVPTSTNDALATCQQQLYDTKQLLWSCQQSCGSGSPVPQPSPAPAANPSPTSAPPNTGSSCDDLVPSANCWNSGCTVQVRVSPWTPQKLVTVNFESPSASIGNIWNAQVISQGAGTATVRLAGYDSDSFGFNMAGSAVTPSFSC